MTAAADQELILCQLCQRALDPDAKRTTVGAYLRIECPRCGIYKLTLMADRVLPHEAIAPDLYLLSGLTRRISERGLAPLTVKAEMLGDPVVFDREVRHLCPVTVEAKIDTMLSYVAEHSAHPGSRLELRLRNDYTVAFCRDEGEFLYYYSYLRTAGMIDDNTASTTDYIRPLMTVKGWERIRSLQVPNAESCQAFIAMWFSDELDEAYETGINAVSKETGYRMLRIDREEFNDRIDDEIIKEIRRSRFLVADVTGHRAGVYFEAGFAMGLGLPVIWTCRIDHIKDAHFDTRQYNHIIWEDPEQLRDALTNRILATIGPAICM